MTRNSWQIDLWTDIWTDRQMEDIGVMILTVLYDLINPGAVIPNGHLWQTIFKSVQYF